MSLLAVVLFSSTVWAQQINSHLESDYRYAIGGKEGTKAGVTNRFENSLGMSTYLEGDFLASALNLKLSYFGGGLDTFGDLMARNPDYPSRVRLEAQSLYIEAFDFIPNVDLRVGRQVVEWGSADMFNPSNVVNALDLEDPIKFGELVPNQMAVVTWNSDWVVESDDGHILFDELAVSLLVIPFYQPSWLPKSGRAAFTDPSLMDVQIDSQTLRTMARLNDAFAQAGGGLEYRLLSEKTRARLENIQYGGRLTMNAFGVSLGASFYSGFSDVVYADDIGLEISHPDAATAQVQQELMFSNNLSDADEVNALIDVISGPIGSTLQDTTVITNITLKNPRIHMVGFDFSTSLDSIGGVGVWGEVACFFHDDIIRNIQAGSEAVEEAVDPNKAFVKLTAGLDYTITPWWYVNAQYMHGFVDEFGSARLNDYLVAVNDFKFFADSLLVRLVMMHQFQDGSSVIYPQLTSTFLENTELTVGGMVYVGEKLSKFGTPAAGPNLAFARARFSF